MYFCSVSVAKFHLKRSLLTKYVVFSSLKGKGRSKGILVTDSGFFILDGAFPSVTAPSLFLFQSDLLLTGLVGIKSL